MRSRLSRMAKADPARARADLEWALDEVSAQLRTLPGQDLLEKEDLEWSLDAPYGNGVYAAVQSRRPSGGHLEMTLLAATTGWFRTQRASRSITVPLW